MLFRCSMIGLGSAAAMMHLVSDSTLVPIGNASAYPEASVMTSLQASHGLRVDGIQGERKETISGTVLFCKRISRKRYWAVGRVHHRRVLGQHVYERCAGI